MRDKPRSQELRTTTAVVEVAVAICLNTNYGSIYGSLFALKLEKLLVNDKIPTSCQARMSFKHYIKPYHKMLQTTKMNLKLCYANKFLKTTISIRFNLLQVCPSVLPFVCAVFIPSFIVLSGLIFMFHSGCSSSFHRLTLNKFRDIVPISTSFVPFINPVKPLTHYHAEFFSGGSRPLDRRAPRSSRP